MEHVAAERPGAQSLAGDRPLLLPKAKEGQRTRPLPCAWRTEGAGEGRGGVSHRMRRLNLLRGPCTNNDGRRLAIARWKNLGRMVDQRPDDLAERRRPVGPSRRPVGMASPSRIGRRDEEEEGVFVGARRADEAARRMQMSGDAVSGRQHRGRTCEGGRTWE